MPEFEPMNTVVAEGKADYLAQKLLEFLAIFNQTYTDSDAAKVQEHFKFITETYIRRACGSVLAEHFIIEAKSDPPIEFDIDVEQLLPAMPSSLFDKINQFRFLRPTLGRFSDPDIERLKE